MRQALTGTYKNDKLTLNITQIDPYESDYQLDTDFIWFSVSISQKNNTNTTPSKFHFYMIDKHKHVSSACYITKINDNETLVGFEPQNYFFYDTPSFGLLHDTQADTQMKIEFTNLA